MKNNYRKLKFSILLQTVLVTALTVLVGGVLLKFVIDGIYNDSFARFFVDALVFLNVNEKTAIHLYWKLVGDNKTFYMIVGYLILFALFFYVALSQMTKYLDQIDHGIENIISESTDPIHLITELKPIEIRLNEIKATLKRQELEASEGEKKKNDLVLFLAHDLKTPLTSIYGVSDMLASGMVKPEDVKGFAGTIKEESARLISLIDDIMRLSQLDENTVIQEKGVIDLWEITQEAVMRLSRKAQENEVELKCVGTSAVMKGVDYIADEIVYNLCENAIKYNKKGGSMTVTVRSEADRCVLTVKDNGIGIPKGEQERIFERFYRVDKSHSKKIGGTGLGLSIVKHGVSYLGGTINVESEEGIGTTITVVFPKNI